jgi:hypothetical protein
MRMSALLLNAASPYSSSEDLWSSSEAIATEILPLRAAATLRARLITYCTLLLFFSKSRFMKTTSAAGLAPPAPPCRPT